jgi:hypothetical protein
MAPENGMTRGARCGIERRMVLLGTPRPLHDPPAVGQEMANKPSEFERKVLALLKKRGPLVSAGLYFLFDPNHTADAQPVLQTLKEQGYIDITEDMMVTITGSGLKRLEDKKY